MIELHTSFTRSDQKQIVISHDLDSDLDPHWLIRYFEAAVAQGTRFQAGQTVQIGWMIVLLKNAGNELEIWEPQFDSIPIKWIKGVRNTLRHLTLQKSIAELMSIAPTFPSLRDAGLASQAFLDANNSDFQMTRTNSSGNVSGWTFSVISDHQNIADGELRSLFELSFFQPLIVPFLALPEGTAVTKRNAELIIELAGRRRGSAEIDLLQKLVLSEIWT